MATIDRSPALTAAVLNTIMAKTVANATPAELRTILDALSRGVCTETATVTSQLP